MRKQRRSAAFWFLSALTAALLIIVLSPFVIVIAGAVLNTSFLGVSTEQWAGGAGKTLISFHWFGYVWDLYHSAFYFSLRLALLCTMLGLAIGIPSSYVLARSNSRASGLIEALIMLPLAIPGIAVSIALIQAYSIVRGSWGLILCGHLLYTLPFMVRLAINALRSFDAAGLEVCAQSLGASQLQRLSMVILPNLRHAMTSGALMVFAVSWGEFNVSFLLNTPINQTYPAALYATYTSNSFQVGSAATVLFLLVSIPALLAIQWIGGDSTSNIDRVA